MTERKNAWRDPLRFAMNARPGKAGTALLFAALMAAFCLLAGKLCAGMEGALVIGGMGSLERLPSFREGLYYVQDPAARLSVLCARLPEGGAKVLDCCAARAARASPPLSPWAAGGRSSPATFIPTRSI